MAFTPGIASAALASMLLIRACAYGLNNSRANSIPSARKSSAYLRAACHFCAQFRRRIVLPDEFLICHMSSWDLGSTLPELPLSDKSSFTAGVFTLPWQKGPAVPAIPASLGMASTAGRRPVQNSQLLASSQSSRFSAELARWGPASRRLTSRGPGFPSTLAQRKVMCGASSRRRALGAEFSQVVSVSRRRRSASRRDIPTERARIHRRG